MSIYKRASSTDRRITKIRERVDYVFDQEKTCPELCHTLGVSRETVYDDMVFVKYLFCQTKGRQYLHWILSHDGGVCLETVNSVAKEVMYLFSDCYQVIAATHTNTSNLHTHFIINPIDIRTGKKFSESKNDMLKFRDKINHILNKFGLKECGCVESVSEEKLDNEDDMLETPHFSEERSCEGEQAFQLFQIYQNQMFLGTGFATEGKVLIPGVLYETEHQEDESETEISQYVDGHTYRGKGRWENGHFLISGVLYEEEE